MLFLFINLIKMIFDVTLTTLILTEPLMNKNKWKMRGYRMEEGHFIVENELLFFS